MRSFGLIIGGLFIADGLTALIGGKNLMKWAESTLGPKISPCCSNFLKRAAEMDEDLYLAWGANNLLAGSIMIALAAHTGCAKTAEPNKV